MKNVYAQTCGQHSGSGHITRQAARPRKEGTGYEIIYGERRYRASLLIGAKTIKAVIHSTITNEEAEDMSITENLQRKEVRPTEEAAAFKQLLDKGHYYVFVGEPFRAQREVYLYPFETERTLPAHSEVIG